MTHSNKVYHIKQKIADLDACSLYPTAMFLMLDFSIGLPNVLNNIQYDFFKSQDV